MAAEKGYALADNGEWYVQLPSEGQFGFILARGDNTWEGGFGSGAHTWTLYEPDSAEVPDEVKESLGWLLED